MDAETQQPALGETVKPILLIGFSRTLLKTSGGSL